MEDLENPKPEIITEVVLDAITAMRIVKHCNENSNTIVAGSLLGLDIDGVLQVTYSFAFPQPKNEGENSAEETDDLDGATYQVEMMKMLRDVNIDNNCIGWYQSMNMGTICTSDVVSYLYSYQSSEELSENSIVIFYDTTLSRRGDLVLKAFRLSKKFMELRRAKASNQFIRPNEILEELPLKIRTIGHASAYVRCLQDTHHTQIDCEFESLNMQQVDTVVEKHLETMSTWFDDILSQQTGFQQYAKTHFKTRQEQIRWLTRRIEDNLEKREQGEKELSLKLDDFPGKSLPELPGRSDHLLVLAQLERYSQQLNDHVNSSLQKLTLLNEVNAPL
jgi:translation initiation factor 3 subunit H